MIEQVIVYVAGLWLVAAVAYMLGEQAAYRSLGYGSERAFSSIMAFLTRRR